jgi:hypothetical protein
MILKDQWKNEADKSADIWNMGYFVLMDESIKRIFYEIREYINKTLFLRSSQLRR